MKTLLNRILAAIVDYLVFVVYAQVLWMVATSIISEEELQTGMDPVTGQLVGFLAMTLPVLLYACLTEMSRWKGTIGKKLFRLTVETDESRPKRILIRNLLKYLPWEIAHIGVHWLMYYTQNQQESPVWIWIVLIVPQIVVLLYFISIIRGKGNGSIYDSAARTRVELKPR